MRNKLLLLLTGFTALLNFTSCVKEAPTLFETSAKGIYLSFIGTPPTVPGRFNYATISTSTVSIKVRGVGAPVDKVNIYVGSSPDKSSWKKIKTVPFTDSATLSVSGAELAAALGVAPTALSPGSTYTFYNEAVTKDGRSFSAANTDADFQGQAAYKMAFVWQGSIFCSFDPSAFSGNFKVVKDSWNDFSVGDPIAVKPGPGANQITITAYPSPAYGTNRKDIVIDVNPDTNEATVAQQVYGDYPPTDFNLSVRGKGSVNSCSGTISLNLIHSEGGVDFGTFALVLQK